MSTERVKAWHVRCDQCGERSLPGKTRRGLRRFLSKVGWDLGRGNVADLCLDCATLDAAPGGTP